MVFLTEQFGRRGGSPGRGGAGAGVGVGGGGGGGGRAGAGARAVGGYVGKQGPGVIVAVVSWILVGVVPTILYGFFQMDWVFTLIENTGEVLVPGRGGLLRWSMLVLFFIFNSTVALGIGGGKKSQFPDPKTGKPLMIFPEWPSVILKVTMYYILAIILPIMFGKPLIANWVVQPLITGLASVHQDDLAFAIADGAQKAGMDVTLPTGEKGKPEEERLCGGYTKFDEKGNVVKGGKQVDVVIGEVDSGSGTGRPPPWESKGSIYRVPMTIKNLINEPLNVVILKGDSSGLTLKTSEKGISFYIDKPGKGTYISGKETPKGEKTTDAYYMLTPLNCLEPAGCLIESGLEKTVELISSSKVAFKENTAASLNVELKISYDKDKGKKGVGTGHMLIFPTSTDAAARQKASNFKSSYCPTTLAGPLDVVVSPPFHTVGGSDKGGDGYFEVKEKSQCPTELDGVKIKEFQYISFKGRQYCVQNLKTVKVRLINADENAHILVKSLNIFPSKAGSSLPQEYTNTFEEVDPRGNCFLESLGEDKSGVVFQDEIGPRDKESLGKINGPLRREFTFLCRYQICDFPPNYVPQREKDPDKKPELGYLCFTTQGGYPISEFKDFQFRAEVEYDYIATFTKGSITMLKENK